MKVFIALEELPDGSVRVTGQSDQLVVGVDGKPIMTPFVEMCQQLCAVAQKFAMQYTEAQRVEVE